MECGRRRFHTRRERREPVRQSPGRSRGSDVGGGGYGDVRRAAGAPAKPRWQGGYRQCQARLPGLERYVPEPALAGARRPWGPLTAPLVGQYEHQGPPLERCRLCRVAHRPGYRGHDCTRDARRVSRPRQGVESPRGKRRRRAAGLGHARALRHLDRRSDRAPSRRGRPTILGGVRHAAGSHRGQARRCAEVGPRPDELPTARPNPWQSKRGARRLAGHGQAAAALGARRVHVDWQRREPVARLARHRRARASECEAADAVRQRSPDEVHARGRFGNGWLEPLPRCLVAHVRPDRGISRAGSSRLDRPRADPDDASAHRATQDALYRLEQVGHDTRAEYPQGLLLRLPLPDRRRGRGGQAFHRRDRPKLGPARACRIGALRTGVFRRTGYRRAILGAVQLRHGARRGHGARRAAVPRAYGDHGARVRAVRAARAKPRCPARLDPRDVGPDRVATKSPSLPLPASHRSERGSNSFWPNPPASRARASSPSTGSLSASRRCMESTDCSPT